MGSRAFASIALSSRVVYYGAPNSEPINYIRARVYDEATGQQIGALEEFLNPDRNEFDFQLQIALEAGRAIAARMTLELANRNPDERVEYSGRTVGIRLQPGGFRQVDIELYPGPLENLDVTGIQIVEPIASIAEGGNVVASASMTGSTSGTRIVWSSLDAGVATINPNSGRIDGVLPGSARIVAAVGRFADTARVTVLPRRAGVVVTPSQQEVTTLGQVVTYTATVVDPRGSPIPNETVAWTVEDLQVASLLQAGQFRAENFGQTQIRATSIVDPSLSGTATLVVRRLTTVPDRRVTQLTAEPTDTTFLSVGGSFAYRVVARNGAGVIVDNPELFWSTSQSAVATVTGSGVVTARAAGTTTITLTSGDVSTTMTVRVVLDAVGLQMVSGNGQSGPISTPASQPLVVRVVNAAGQGVPGVKVSFSTTAGNGTITSVNATSDASGNASATWTFGAAMGTQFARATSSPLSGSPIEFTATVTSGSPKKLSFVTQPSLTAAARAPFARQPVVQLLDEFNHPVNVAGVSITAFVGGGSSAVILDGVAVTNAQGRATFTNLAVGAPIGPLTLSFTGPGLDIISAPVTLSEGAPASIVILSQDPQTAAVGSAVTSIPTVAVVDADGNRLSGVPVWFTVTAGGGQVASTTVTTDASGLASADRWTLGMQVGTNTLTASVIGLAPVVLTANGTPGAASLSTSTITAAPASLTADGTSTSTITVRLKDANGNNLTASGGTVTLTRTGTGTLSAVTDNGNGTYIATLTAPTTVGSASITALLGGAALTNASNPATVSFVAGSATRLVITGATNRTAGAAEVTTITARDASGNVVTSYNGNKTLTFSGASIAAAGQQPSATNTASEQVAFGTATTVAFVNGVATTSVRLTKAESATLAVTDGTIGATGADRLAVTVGAGTASASTSTLSVSPTSRLVNETSTITVVVRDAFGNILTGATGAEVSVGTTAGSIGAFSCVSGTCTATFTAPATSGAATITGTIGGTALPNSPTTITVTSTPVAPTISGITSGNQQLSVAFTASSNGGSPITNYQYSTDDGATWTTVSPASTTSPIVITGLTNGTTYQIRLRAINGVGTGSASTPTSGTPTAAPTAPGAPAITGITVGDQQLTVAFTAPASNGGSPITNYEYSTDDGVTWTTVSPASTTSPIVITGLTNGTTYSIRLRAINGVGTGSVATPVSGTPATVPAAPTITSITVGDQQLTVAFTAPTSNGGSPITNYEYSTDDGVTWTTVSPATTTSPIVITGLTNGTNYPVRVRAVNARGSGDQSNAISAAPVAASVTISATSPTSLTEANLTGATVTLDLTNATYAASIDQTNFSLATKPTGTTITSVSRTSATRAVVTLAFDGSDFDVASTISVNVLQSALATGSAATTGTVAVTPTAASSAVLSGASSVLPNAVSMTVTLESREANGSSMTVAVNEAFELTSNSTGTPQFWTNANGTGAITSATITIGSSSAIFYYQDNAAGSWTIMATDGTDEGVALGAPTRGMSVSTTTAAIQSTSPGSLTEANLNAATVTVDLTNATYAPSIDQTNFSLATKPAGTTITSVSRTSASRAVLTLAFDGTDFDVSSTLSVNVLQSALATGSAATTGTVAVAPTAASGAVLTGATTGTAGTVTGALTIEARESNGTAMTVAVDEAFALSSSSTGTKQFWSNANGTGAITVLTIGSGNASASFYYQDDLAGNWAITATDGVDEGAALGSPTATMSVSAGSGTRFVITGAPTQTAGAAQTITLTAKDGIGNTVVAYTGNKSITFSGAATAPAGNAPTATSTTPAAVGFGTATALNFANGVATTSLALYKVESALIAATDGAMSATGSDRLSVMVAAADASLSQSTVSASPTSLVANGSTASTITIQLKDPFGNATATGAGTGVTGVATVGTLGAFATSGGGTHTASLTSTAATASQVTGSINGSTITNASNPVSVTFTPDAISAGANGTQLSGTNTSRVANGTSAATLTVQLRDATGNNISQNGVAVTFASTLGTLSSTTATTDANGVASVTLTSTVSGAASVTATVDDDGNGGTAQAAIANGSPVAVTFAAGIATKLVITGSANQTAGVAQTVQITAKDANGNTATGYTGDKLIAFSGAAPSATNITPTATDKVPAAIDFGSDATITFANGVASSSMVLYKAESATIAVTDGSILTTAGDRLNVSVVAATANAAASTATVPNGTVDEQTTITIQAKDAFGNNQTTGGLTFVVAVSGANNATPSITDHTNGTYTARYTPTVSGTDAVAITLGGPAISGSPYTSVVTAGSIAKFVVTGNPAQIAGVSQQITITAKDGSGNTVTAFAGDQPIVFTGALASLGGTAPTINDKDGTAIAFTNPTTLTFVNGAVTTAMKLYKVEAANIVATRGGTTTTGADRLTVAVSAAAASALSVTTQPTGAVSGVALTGQPVVQLRDAYGNTAPEQNVTVTASLNVPGGAAATLGGTGATATSNAGIATYTNLAITGTATTGYTLTFTASLGGTDKTVTSSAFALAVGAATQLVMTTQPQSAANSGEALPTAPVVELRDASNNAVSTAGVTVLAVLNVPNGAIGTLIGSATASTAGNGRATFTGLGISGQAATVYTLTFSATVGGTALTTATSNNVTLSATTASKVTITTQPPTSATNGAVLSITPVVQLRDINNNPVANNGVVITATSSCTLTGTTTAATDDGGAAYFDDLVVNGTAGATCTITFAKSGLTSATSNNITIVAGAASFVAVNGSYTTTAVVATSLASKPSVIVTDAGGNPTSGVSITFAIENGGGSLTGATQSTDANGIATLGGWTLGTTAGTHTVLASVNASSVTGDPVRFTVTATAAAASSITIVEGNTQSASAGTTVATPPSVIVKDQYANPVSSASVTYAVIAGGGTVNPLTAIATSASGVATVTSWTLGTTAGTNNQTLRATLSGGGSVDFTASAIAGAASSMVVSGTQNVTGIAVGASAGFSPTVLVRDANNNPVSGYSVLFVPATGSGTVATSVATTNSSGLATAGTWTVGSSTTPSTHTVVASAGGMSNITFSAGVIANANATPASITVTPAAATVALNGSRVQVQSQLKDVDGNSLSQSGVAINWAATGGAGISSVSTGGSCVTSLTNVNTDAAGKTTVFVCTTTAAEVVMTASQTSNSSVNGTASVAVLGAIIANNECKTAPIACTLALTTTSTSVPLNTNRTISIQLNNEVGQPANTHTTTNTITWTVTPSSGATVVNATNTFGTDGKATATFSATSSGSYDVSASYSGSGGQPVGPVPSNTLTFTAAAPSPAPASAATSTVSATPTSMAANGTSTSVISIQLKDASGNNTTNGSVASIAVSGGIISGLSGSNGAYAATFTTSTTAGTAVVTPVLTSGGSFVNSVLITKTASAYRLTMTQNGTVIPGGTTLAAGTTVRVTAKMVDGAGNLVTNVTGGTVTWGKTGTGGTFSSATSTVSNGVAFVDFTTGSTSHTVSVTDNRYTYPLTGSTVTGSPITQPAGYVVTTSNVAADIGETVTITAQLVDGSNNPVTAAGRTVNWTATTDGVGVTVNNNASLGTFSALSSTTNASGIATVTFTVSSVAYRLHVIRATDAASATPACVGSPCTGVSQEIETGVALIGLPSTVPANAQRTSITFNYPAGVRAGDLIVVSLNLSNSGGGNPSLATITSGGWTEFQKLDNIPGQLSMRVLYRIATGTETGTVQIDIDPMQRVGGALMVYRNVDTSNPISGLTSTIQTVAQTGTAPFTISAPQTVTPSRINSRIVTLYEHSASGSNRLTLPAGTVQLFRYDGSNSTGGQYTVIAGAQTHQNAADTVVPAAVASNTASGMFIATQFIIRYKP